uniref:CSON013703 protein n=1 Tax=Culicoides sonorensis TaxID=179676 RepID=A0A336LLZ0_CULSO
MVKILFYITCFYFLKCNAAKRDVLDLFGASYGQIFHPTVQVFPTASIESTSVLPEIIINRQARPFDPRSNRNGGYIINRPSFPFNPAQTTQLDPEINNEYLPPSSERPFNEYLPPPTTSTTPLPSVSDEEINNDGYYYDPPDNSYIPPASGPYNQRNAKDLDFFHSSTNSLSGMKVELKEMKCMSNPNGYFKAQMQIHNNIDTFPIVEHDSSDPRCEIRTLRSQALVNIVSDDFSRCGIYKCAGNDLCLRVRFPLIRGLRTRDDLILTLQCKLHEKIVGKIHTIKLGINQFQNQGRSNDGTGTGIVAQGGGNQQFRSQVGLFRKIDENGFSQPLTPGSTVQLGEELMLRTQVKAGDGWNYTRISDVALQRFSPQGELLNSVNLISPNGCLNNLMRNICPHEPIFEPPLGYKLGFKAFMFQGMKSGDELVMNVKLNGCLYKRDCVIDGKCQHARGKRDVNLNETKDEETLPLEIVHLLFRVKLPDEEKINQSDFYKNINYTINPYKLGTLTATGLICTIGGLILIIYFIKTYKKYKVLT